MNCYGPMHSSTLSQCNILIENKVTLLKVELFLIRNIISWSISRYNYYSRFLFVDLTDKRGTESERELMGDLSNSGLELSGL